jgi:hypothetical protein
VEITESCLDAETLAAWVDGGLTAPELERAQTHVAGCLRCQAMVGTLARINAAAPAAKAERARSWRGWFGWVVPIAAAAAAVTIYVSIPGSQLNNHLDTSVKTAPPPQATAVVPEMRAAGQETVPAAPAPPASPARERNETRIQAGPSAAALEKTPQAAPILPPTSMTAESAVAPSVATPPAAAPRDVAPGAPPAAPPAAPAPAQAAAADSLSPNSASGSVGAGVASGVAGRLTGGGGGGAGRGGGGRGVLMRTDLASPPVEIASPAPMVRWRLVGNLVERSTDGGASWEVTTTGVSVPLTAGAAVSTTVCWVVGREGVVLLSTDGRTWRHVPAPTITDLVSVRARDALTATVTTADGRLFSTATAGATWIPGPLQGF